MAIICEVRDTGTTTAGGFFESTASGTDYSQQDSPQWSLTGLTNVGAVFTYASAVASMVGNYVYMVAGTSVGGRFRIASVVVGVSFTLATSLTSGSGRDVNIGGAISVIDGNARGIAATFYIKSGTYAVNATSWQPTAVIGYQTTRGDTPTGTNRPKITSTDNTGSHLLQSSSIRNIIIEGVAPSSGFGLSHSLVLLSSTGSAVTNCAIRNFSSGNAIGVILLTTANTTANHVIDDCELFSSTSTLFVIGVSGTTSGTMLGRAHVVVKNTKIIGIQGARLIGSNSAASLLAEYCVFMCHSYGIDASTYPTVVANTFYGDSTAQVGSALSVTSNDDFAGAYIAQNVFYGLNNPTGASYTSTNLLINNDFYDCINTVSQQLTGQFTVDPQFTDVTEIRATGCTTSAGGVITKTGAFTSASIVANASYVHVLSGTGVTAGYYLITAKTDDSLTTNPAIATNATADKSVVIVIDNDWTPCKQLKDLLIGGGYAQSYPVATPKITCWVD